ncbi:MAG: NAD-dependent epimerase/dehydratase family protein [Candidatus Competibacteraceae bacterium]|nr:NAD-dependent epimerase/dehydratase family protein [Candidatus Competibacteraceae bacterium]
MKNILVLGGTGAMGKHLVQLLAERGDKICVTTRASRESSTNIEYIQGNAREDSFLESLLVHRWDAIVDFMVYTTPVFQKHVPRLLAATDQYIFLSSARVYANSPNPIKEDSPRLLDSSTDSNFLAIDEYSLAKARQENFLKQSGHKNWTIIRPYITYSEQRLQLGVLEKEGWLYRALQGRTIVFSKDIANKMTTLTYGLDVATAMVALIGEHLARGEVYHITQGQSHSWYQVLDIYLKVLEKHLGQQPNVILLDMDKFSRCKRAEYQIKYDRMFDRTFNNNKISKFVDLGAFQTLEQGLTQCLEGFLKNPEFLPIDWQSEAVKDRYCGEMASLKELGHWKQKIKYLLYRFIKY